ncbi:hypothetical protein LT493_23420 [Streptomyces tricolor]|nr:hypothetical protein [Streptomyces tricolor]
MGAATSPPPARCTSDQVQTDHQRRRRLCGALTARRLNADYQINGYSGLGMVRNYNGGSPDVTYRTFYDRALLNVPGDVWQEPGHLAPAARGGQPRHQRLLDPRAPR